MRDEKALSRDQDSIQSSKLDFEYMHLSLQASNALRLFCIPRFGKALFAQLFSVKSTIPALSQHFYRDNVEILGLDIFDSRFFRLP